MAHVKNTFHLLERWKEIVMYVVWRTNNLKNIHKNLRTPCGEADIAEDDEAEIAESVDGDGRIELWEWDPQ